MDYREEIVKILMDDISIFGLEMAYGVIVDEQIDIEKRKEAGYYKPPKLGRKMEAVRLLMEIDDSDKRFLNRVLVILNRHNRKKGGAA